MAEHDVDAELEAIEHLDFTPVCESKRCDGQTPATRVLVLMLPCCSARVVKYTCTPCKERNLRPRPARDHHCSRCGRVTFQTSIAEHIAVLTIGGAR